MTKLNFIQFVRLDHPTDIANILPNQSFQIMIPILAKHKDPVTLKKKRERRDGKLHGTVRILTHQYQYNNNNNKLIMIVTYINYMPKDIMIYKIYITNISFYAISYIIQLSQTNIH